jgi:anti-sigma B factor antagonist
MEIKASLEGDVNVVALSGRIDPQAAVDLKKDLAPLVGDSKKLLIDMAEISYIGSAGLRELFFAAKNLERNGGKLVCSNLQPEVKRIFEIAGFSIPYQIFDSRSEALAALK